jgi:beta-glucanase (GH16 family)
MMRARRVLIAALILVASCVSARAEGWKVVFEDRFAGTALDRTKWATRFIYEGETKDYLNDEMQRYRDNDNHEVKDGSLSLIARRLPNGKLPGPYESGLIRSRQTFYYGYFEAKVRLTTAKGTWPAFWLNADYDRDGGLRWPPEIDAFEYVINGTNETPDMIHSSVVVDKAGTQGGGWLYRDPAFNERWTYYRAPAPLNQDWVVIAVLWKPDSVTQYVNGKKTYTRTYKWVYSDGSEAADLLPGARACAPEPGDRWALGGLERRRRRQAPPGARGSICPCLPVHEHRRRCGRLRRQRLHAAARRGALHGALQRPCAHRAG